MAFVVDDSTPEDADYVDQCLIPIDSKQKKNASQGIGSGSPILSSGNTPGSNISSSISSPHRASIGNGLGSGILDATGNIVLEEILADTIPGVPHYSIGDIYGLNNIVPGTGLDGGDVVPVNLIINGSGVNGTTGPTMTVSPVYLSVPATYNIQFCLPSTVTIDGQEFSYPSQSITLPESSFLLQDGSIEPVYPEFVGAFVYDLQYKKWGKMYQAYKQLLNYSPINTHAGDGTVPADIFSVNAGCLLSSGKIALFDKYPLDSIIKYGKIGYYRNGFTDCEGVTVQFRTQATGSISLEGSVDGKLLLPSISQQRSYTNTLNAIPGFSSSARWFNVCISGFYDIKNIDFQGWKKGKR